ncbi:MAG TPA: acetolactate synthase small subunit [Ktedonobacteraceae bacterium]
MSNATAVAPRAGQSDVEQSSAYALVVVVADRPGSVDRVVGHLRRRRANMQTLVLGRSEQPEYVRLSVTVNDSEVGVDHLVEQLRKIADVRQVQHFALQQALIRELALICFSTAENRVNEIITLAHQFGAYAIDVTPETLTLEVTGSVDKVEQLVDLLRKFGIREVAYSGQVAISRGAAAGEQ